MSDQGQSILIQIWEATTKLSGSAIEAARVKAEPLGIDKGQVTFSETQINLVHSRDVIADAVKNDKLIQLPISIQTGLLNLLNSIVAHLTALANGTDEIVLFVDKVEQLNVFIWANGFYNLSSEVLGYQEKMNRLKTMELDAEKLINELKASEKLQKTAAQTAKNIEELQQSSNKRVGEIEDVKKQIEDVASKASVEQQTVLAAVASVKQQNEDAARLVAAITVADGQVKISTTQIAALLTSTTTKAEELNATVATGQQNNRVIKETADALSAKLSKDISEQHELQIANFEALTIDLGAKATALETASIKAITDFKTLSQQDLETAHKESKAALQKVGLEWNANANEGLRVIQERADILHTSESEKLTKLTEELLVLELRIKDQVQKAIGFSLFNAFQRRQRFIVASKTFWRNALFVFVVAGIACGGYFIFALKSMPVFTYAYLAKLSLSLPVIYAISFCSIQYGKERRLEEEYAFKASISVSLNPYQKLVDSLVDHKVPEERAKYTDFIIRSIDAVFQSPTERVYDGESKQDDASSIEKATKLLGPILDPIAKILGRK
jgi:hypothetical protein